MTCFSPVPPDHSPQARTNASGSATSTPDYHLLPWLLTLDDTALTHWATQAARTKNDDQLELIVQIYLLHAGRNQARTSPHTLQTYRRGLRAFLTWAADADLNLLVPERRELAAYRAHLQQRPGRGKRGKRHLAPTTVATLLSVAQLLYRALRWTGVIEGHLPEPVRSAADATAGIVKNPPYDQDLDALLPRATPEAQALLLLCAHSGLRITEALSARRSHHRGPLLEVRGKGSKIRRVPLSARTRAALLAVPAAADQDAYFTWTYNQAYYHMQTLFHGAGVPWRGFHAARKTAASRLYQQTRDFTRVALFLGHDSADTTRRYVKVNDDDVAAEIEAW
ncbi:tyrosine-type recombinase/integrase [Deinococcus petrolearius]|uniref:Tyrosine-type recombinase/integrase n=1 Tax=Deinococcus petrolearius TaxID=1751295 RepID=A0ABW1DNS3_9DEIO